MKKLTETWLKRKGIPFEEEDGRLTVFDSLDLSCTGITSLPENLTVGSWLDLSGTNITSLPENLTVGSWLDLSGTNITSLPNNLTVGGSLYLNGTNITSLPENMTVGCSLYLNDTGITSLPDNLTVGGGLDLNGTGITSLPDNLTVGGGLDLNGTGITSLPENLTVGSWLDLRGTGITSLPDNLTVGGSLYSYGTGINQEEKKKVKKPAFNIESLLTWKGGKYRVFDGIFCEVLCKKKNVWKVKIGNKIQFVVTDGERFAHGETIEKARDSLMYKISERDTSAYEHLRKNSVLTKEEAIKMYLVITGACEAGTRHFVETNSDKIKDTMTVSEIIKITEGQYGSDKLKTFFRGKK